MLNYGFEGIKTGITDTAGPCLATSIKINSNNSFISKNNEEVHLVLILLNCISMEARWRETIKLMKYGYAKIAV